MPHPLSFEKAIARLPYAAQVLGSFFSQHLLVLAILQLSPRFTSIRMDWAFALMPLHMFGIRTTSSGMGQETDIAAALLAAVFLYQLLLLWSFVALSFRRTVDAGWPGWIVVLAIVPIIQIAVFLGLSLAPSHARTQTSLAMDGERAARWATGTRGLLAGIALTVAAVALSTLVFGSYGFGVFIISPFIIGATTAAIANARHDIGARNTNRLVAVMLMLGGLALIAVALEGAICLIMAAPLGFAMSWLGGILGRAIANYRPNAVRQTLSSVAVLPVVLAGEFLFAPMALFETNNTIFIDAPPARVWEAIVKMERIDGPPPPAARLGIAYALGATLVGEGVGATRIATFSTGNAVERVTEWDAGRKLTFAILQDAPSMRELSPYANLHAPHSVGYFSTTEIRFELVAGEGGGTRLIEHTSHALKLAPVLYWLPLARVIVGQNNAHVLAWIKRRAEDNSSAAHRDFPSDIN